MGDNSTLPPVTRQRIMDVDLTPDAEYPLRILRAYRANCDCRWEVQGLGEGREKVHEKMNRDQELRAKLLDRAIFVLEFVFTTA